MFSTSAPQNEHNTQVPTEYVFFDDSPGFETYRRAVGEGEDATAAFVRWEDSNALEVSCRVCIGFRGHRRRNQQKVGPWCIA